MSEAARYSAIETLRDGRSVNIRAFKPEDRAGLLAAVGRASAQSIYRRFFNPKRNFSEGEIEFFSNLDFECHVALVATVEKDAQSVIASGRYIVSEPGQAEVAFLVVDAYQGLGIGGALMRHLIAIARGAGLRELIAEVLAENAPMLRVFEKCGLRMSKRHEGGGVVHITLQLA